MGLAIVRDFGADDVISDDPPKRPTLMTQRLMNLRTTLLHALFMHDAHNPCVNGEPCDLALEDSEFRSVP